MSATPTREAIAKNIKSMRKAAGFSSANAFADYIGMKPGRYTAYEQNQASVDLEVAWIIADALGCTLDELAGREVPQPSYADQRQAALNRIYARMNDAGKTKAVDNVRDLAGNPAYQEGSKSGVDAAEIGA